MAVTDENLKILFQEAQLRELKKLEIIENAERKLGQILSFKGINEIFFLYNAFILGDFQGSKEYLYKIGMVNSYYSEVVNRDIFEVLNTFSFPLLSDNSKLIKRYLQYEVSEYPDAFSSHFAKSIQAVLLHNDEKLELHIKGLEKRSHRGWEKNFRGMVTSFTGFLHNDKLTIEQGIHELLALHDNQGHMPITKNYINFEATALAKLAYYKGIEVDIKSRLVPKELLPVKELVHYQGYDFFSELKEII